MTLKQIANFFKTHILQRWIQFGNLIGKINYTIIIFFLFFFIFTPMAILLKIFGKDLLNKKLDKNCESYFKPRTAPLSDMKNQF